MQKKAARRGQRALAFLLCLLMVATLLPVMGASAAKGDVSATGVELNKTLSLETDGTYTITLEAYATGTVTTTEVTEPVPTDFVLVLDQSGSMKDTITSYTYTEKTSQEYSYSSLKNQTLYYKDGDAYYQVKRDSYKTGRFSKTYHYYLYYQKDDANYYLSGNGTTETRPSEYTNSSDTIWTGVLYMQTKTSQTKLAALKKAVTNFVTSVQNQKYANGNSVAHRIAIVGFASDSSSSYQNTELFVGSSTYPFGTSEIDDQYVNALQDVTTSTGRNNLTDSINALAAEGSTYAQHGFTMANKVLDKRTVKTYTKADGTTADRGAVVVMFTDGQPGYNNSYYDQKATADATIEKARTTKKIATVFTIGVFSVEDSTYLQTSNMWGGTQDSPYTIKDYMTAVSSDYPSASSLSNKGSKNTDGKEYYATADDSEALNDAFQSVPSSVNSSSTSCELDAVSVLKDIISGNLDLPEGFNATENVSVKTADYNGDEKAAESITFNDFDDEHAAPLSSAEVDVSGKTVKVSNFDYKNNYVTGVANKDGTFSGKKLIVTITGLIPNQAGDGQFSNEDTSGIYHNGELRAAFERPSFSVASRNVVIDFGMTANIAENVGNKNTREGVQDENGGTFTYGDDNTLTFKPTVEKDKNGNYTLPFTGVSSALYYGVDYAAVGSPSNAWTWVNVIPANNVYYDDTFLSGGDTGSSTFTDGQYGYEANVPATTDTTSVSSGETTFTFKGSRIDVYCTTESTSGAVIGQLKNSSGEVLATKLMRNEYKSGALYNVPTLSFETPNASATYTLTITTNNQSNYKLDGVRVYHPADETNETVQNAYANDDEQNAVFTQVRQMLLQDGFNTGSVEGAAYTDQVRDGSHTTNVVSTYTDYGPKNEVYLATGNGIAVKIDNYNPDTQRVMIGLSAPEAGAGSVNLTNDANAAPLAITSVNDMYYNVTPTAEGYVFIQNTGTSLIAVTNIKVTGADTSAVTYSVDEDLLAYAANFDSLEVTEPTPDEPDPIPDTPVQNDSISAIIHAIWAQVKTSIDRLFGRL